MPTINQLSSINTLTTSDQLVVYQTSSGDARKASLGTFLDWFKGAFASPDFETQYAAPTLSGFVVTLTQSTQSIWLLLQPVNAMAAGTIVLPAPSASWDQQEIAVFTSVEIQALAVNGSGATVNGAPTYLPANGSFTLRYNALQMAWFCVQSSAASSLTYQASPITWQYMGAGQTGVVTYSGRVTQIGRQVTLEALIEVGAAPGDQLVWTYATDKLQCVSLTQPPLPWGGYAITPAAVGAMTTVLAGITSQLGTATIVLAEPAGGASLTLPSGMALHIAATYTST